MRLKQITYLKRWLIGHDHHLGLIVCDAVLGAWIAGWAILPVMLLLDVPELLPVSLILIFLPELYVALRRLLHRKGFLRCDWLVALD
jgi:hypothetical protein